MDTIRNIVNFITKCIDGCTSSDDTAETGVYPDPFQTQDETTATASTFGSDAYFTARTHFSTGVGVQTSLHPSLPPTPHNPPTLRTLRLAGALADRELKRRADPTNWPLAYNGGLPSVDTTASPSPRRQGYAAKPPVAGKNMFLRDWRAPAEVDTWSGLARAPSCASTLSVDESIDTTWRTAITRGAEHLGER